MSLNFTGSTLKWNNLSVKTSVPVNLPFLFEALLLVRVRHALGLGNTLNMLNVY